MKDLSGSGETQRGQALDLAEPLAEDASGDCLAEIRNDWLSAAAAAESTSGIVPAPRRKSRSLVEVDFLALVKSIGAIISWPFRKFSASLGDKAKKGLLPALLAVVLIGGAWVYTVVVGFILDPSTVPAVAQTDSLQASPSASSSGSTLPANAADSATASSTAESAGVIHVRESSISGLDRAISFDGAKAAHVANEIEVSQQNDPRAGLAGDQGATFTQAADAASHRARDAQALQIQSATQPPPPVRMVAVAANTSATSSPSPESADQLTYPDFVRASQGAPANNDVQSAYKPVAQAEALNAGSPSAVHPVQMRVAASGNSGGAPSSALESIAHGGRAAFELQYQGAQPGSVQPAKIVITATTLQFTPESSAKAHALSIPLASITSVQIGRNASGQSGSSLLIINFNDAKNSAGQLSFTDASRRLESSTAGQSQSSSSQQTAQLAAIRNVILTAKSRSR